MAGVRRFTLDGIEPEPWRNGMGLTRTIARSPPGGAAQWRISVADIEGDAPFSAFPGMERAALLMHGAGLELHGTGGAPIRFGAVGEVARFAGETALQARLHAGPVRLWNVMTLRGRWRARLQLREGPADDVGRDGPAVILVLAGGLDAHVAGRAPPIELAAGEGLVLQAARPGLRLEPRSPGPAWIHAEPSLVRRLSPGRLPGARPG